MKLNSSNNFNRGSEIIYFSIVYIIKPNFVEPIPLFLQILMNALRTLMVVLKHVQTELAAIHVPAALVIAWRVMDVDVMVNPYNLKLIIPTV